MGSRDWWLYWNNCKQNIISLQDFLNWCHVYCTFAEIHAVSLDIKDVYYHDILDKKSWNSSDFFSKLFLNMGLLCSVGYYSLHTNVLEFSWRGYLLCWFEKKKLFWTQILVLMSWIRQGRIYSLMENWKKIQPILNWPPASKSTWISFSRWMITWHRSIMPFRNSYGDPISLPFLVACLRGRQLVIYRMGDAKSLFSLEVGVLHLQPLSFL